MGVKVVIGNIVSVMAVVTGVDGGDHHHDDVYDFTMVVVMNSPRSPLARGTLRSSAASPSSAGSGSGWCAQPRISSSWCRPGFRVTWTGSVAKAAARNS